MPGNVDCKCSYVAMAVAKSRLLPSDTHVRVLFDTGYSEALLVSHRWLQRNGVDTDTLPSTHLRLFAASGSGLRVAGRCPITLSFPTSCGGSVRIAHDALVVTIDTDYDVVLGQRFITRLVLDGQRRKITWPDGRETTMR